MDEGRVSITEGVVFGTGGGRDLRCDVFAPPGGGHGGPGVVLVHGGGWRSGDRTQLRGYGVLLGREGYVCMACEYRLIPEGEWPAQIHDVKAAVRWMRANASSLGVDPGRITIEGNSAGAHLALLVAGTPGLAELEGEGGNPSVGTEVTTAIGVYAPTSFSYPGWAPGAVPLAALTEHGSADVAATASPLTHVGPWFPPTLLIHGTADQTVPVVASVQMYEALTAAGVPVELHLYAEQPHAFDAEPRFGRQCAAEMRLFLDRYA
jgi:acetyl esterase/lipase